jgi:hypothetical protein
MKLVVLVEIPATSRAPGGTVLLTTRVFVRVRVPALLKIPPPLVLAFSKGGTTTAGSLAIVVLIKVAVAVCRKIAPPNP